MTTRTFANPEELMIALLQGEKWAYSGVICEYDKTSRAESCFRASTSRVSEPIGSYWTLCDGKTLWTKVEEKTELALMEEKYASGNYYAVYFVTGFLNKWMIKGEHGFLEGCKLIALKDEAILKAYLADNSVEIYLVSDFGKGLSLFESDTWIKMYNEAFEYRLKPKKKTVQLAQYTCKNVVSTKWTSPCVCETFKEFKEYYCEEYFINHHEIPNTRYEQELDDE